MISLLATATRIACRQMTPQHLNALRPGRWSATSAACTTWDAWPADPVHLALAGRASGSADEAVPVHDHPLQRACAHNHVIVC
jgi:hypothetical protein